MWRASWSDATLEALQMRSFFLMASAEGTAPWPCRPCCVPGLASPCPRVPCRPGVRRARAAQQAAGVPGRVTRCRTDMRPRGRGPLPALVGEEPAGAGSACPGPFLEAAPAPRQVAAAARAGADPCPWPGSSIPAERIGSASERRGGMWLSVYMLEDGAQLLRLLLKLPACWPEWSQPCAPAWSRLGGASLQRAVPPPAVSGLHLLSAGGGLEE